MNERLDYLLSVALDDELDNEERAELDRLLVDHPEAAERRARFESINGVVKTIGAQPSNRDVGLDAGFLALQERLDEVGPEPVDELARRRRPFAAWVPSLGLAAAAAMAVYLVLPQDSSVPDGFADSARSGLAVVAEAEKVATADRDVEIDGAREADVQAERVDDRVAETKAEPSERRAARMPAPMLAKSALVPATPARALVDEPIALAVVFEIDEDPESIDFIDSMSPDDFEIIEQLELLEFMAAKASETVRESEGRG